jgi:hypothetical protein
MTGRSCCFGFRKGSPFRWRVTSLGLGGRTMAVMCLCRSVPEAASLAFLSTLSFPMSPVCAFTLQSSTVPVLVATSAPIESSRSRCFSSVREWDIYILRICILRIYYILCTSTATRMYITINKINFCGRDVSLRASPPMKGYPPYHYTHSSLSGV